MAPLEIHVFTSNFGISPGVFHSCPQTGGLQRFFLEKLIDEQTYKVALEIKECRQMVQQPPDRGTEALLTNKVK